MLPLDVVTFSAEDEDRTEACTGDQPATTFVANEFWCSASATNGREPMPSDLGNAISFPPFGKRVETSDL